MYPRLTLDRPVKCGNSRIIETINHPDRTISKEWLSPINRDGKLFCAWCNENELPKSRKKYCSDDCVDSSSAYCYPQSSSHSFKFLMVRQDYRCAGCDFDYRPSFKKSKEQILKWMRRDVLGNINSIKVFIPSSRAKGYSEFNTKDDLDDWDRSCRKSISDTLKEYFAIKKDGIVWHYRVPDQIRNHHRVLKDNHEPEIDHIIPIALGGMAIGFDNVQILCYSCHKEKTKLDIKEIRKNANP
jgi:hypothetical protein